MAHSRAAPTASPIGWRGKTIIELSRQCQQGSDSARSVRSSESRKRAFLLMRACTKLRTGIITREPREPREP